ncbi:DUF4232 domain-containing protein [Streptomyces sp. NPDC059009]|uniref:DUF4232 domain-containing protein n=1 Tax=Streptomyces sp. NPDC059009 TaxID=3346694 RepID=UPI0036CBD858
MKLTRTAALAALGLAATLSLTACNGDDTAQGSSADKGSSSSSSSGGGAQSDGGAKQQDGAKPEGGSGTGGSQADDGKAGSGKGAEAGAAANGGGKSGGKLPICKTADLAIDAADAAPDETSGRINITMINRGSATCSATGFAGVDIKDADNTSSPIERGQAQPRVTTLKPGDAAVFNLAYDIDSSGNSLASPTNIEVTPPNETHSVTLDWPENAGAIKGAYTDVQVFPTHTTE